MFKTKIYIDHAGNDYLDKTMLPVPAIFLLLEHSNAALVFVFIGGRGRRQVRGLVLQQIAHRPEKHRIFRICM